MYMSWMRIYWTIYFTPLLVADYVVLTNVGTKSNPPVGTVDMVGNGRTRRIAST